MPASAALPPFPPEFPSELPLDELLQGVLDISQNGLVYYLPIYDPAGSGEVVDFAFNYLNPAAQRMLRLPAQPPGTHLDMFPESRRNGSLAFHRDTFLSGEPGTFETNYQADGYDNYFRVAGRRLGPGLLVSFTDTADHPRTAVEVALREAQLREQTARAEAEVQRQQLHEVLHQAPAAIALLDGASYRIMLANPTVCELWARPPAQLLGQPLLDALPELQGQGVEALLDGVLHTGTPYVGTELPFDLMRHGRRETVYFNFVYQPQRDASGAITGVLVVATDVTPVVLARQVVEAQERTTAELNEELAAANEEIQANNEEIRATNEELQHNQTELLSLNQELDARVQQRTHELTQALEETRRQREQLRTQQGHLQHILGQVPASVATLTGPDHRYTFFNGHYQTLSGQRTRLGIPVAEVFPEVVAQGFIDLLDQVYATGVPFVGVETPALLYDEATGQPKQRYVDFIYQPLLDGRDQTTGILAFIVDVTDKVLARQHAETLQAELLAAAQRQAQEREAFHEVFEKTPALIQLLRGPSHRVDYANPAYQALFPGRPLVGLDLGAALPELREQGFIALMDHVYQTGETYYATDTPFVQPATAGRPARTGYFTFTYQAYTENDQRAGISVFAHDVTEQVLARQEREAQRQQLQEVFAQAPVAVCVFRGENAVLDVVNPSMAEMLGHPLAALVGRPMFEVLPELRSQGLPALLAEVRRTGVPFVAQEQKIQLARHRPGEPGYFTYVYQPLLADDGRVRGIVCVATDVTEQVHAREQVQALNEELAAINEEMQVTNEELNDSNLQLTHTNVDLDNFIYTASHDLKAPISNIEGLLYLLREELPVDVALAANVAPTLDFMLDAVERFKRTIEHLTEVSKLQKEHSRPVDAVNLAAVVEDVRQDLLPLLQETNAQLTVHLPDFPPVLFPEKNLRSVVYNLLSNALKYRHPDRRPHIDVRGHVRPGFTVVEVHDNGLGLEPQHLAKLFGMFQRFHSHVEGTGIGLYMVKRMVDNAGGRIEVHSQLGAGTTFFVYLPHSPAV